MRRRLAAKPEAGAHELLEGLYGTDLNPLAVLTARASIVVFLAGRFRPAEPVLLPVFLADAVNTAEPVDGIFTHTILTERGDRTFSIPQALAESESFFGVMEQMKACINAGLSAANIMDALKSASFEVHRLPARELGLLEDTISDLVDLHRNHWNGIWCLILFDRIKAGAIRDVDFVVGNPPWVKWSHLPRTYAEFIKPICDRMGIFSDDVWVGGIQSDISTVVTYRALERFVRKGGSLAFLITGTVFKNESSQGLRRWQLRTADGIEPMTIELVEDYAALRPFEDAANWPTLLVVRRNSEPTAYPVKYRIYEKSSSPSKRRANRLAKFRDLRAAPVPGTDAGPWVVGSARDWKVWPKLFKSDPEGSQSAYRARKGITTDMNGVYFVEAKPCGIPNFVQIENDPSCGRRRDIAAKTAIVEAHDVFPLLRGRNVQRFRATPPAGQCVIVPQRAMFGDPALPGTRPKTFQYLAGFKSVLEKRSSYRRFQQGKPFWSIWSTGDYTFSPFKVVWKEMSGGRFCAAMISESPFPGGPKLLIPDHKVYFVALDREDEAAYLTAFLNARSAADAVNAYSSALSLGTSVVDYLAIPKFDDSNALMLELADMGRRFSKGEAPSSEDEDRMDELVLRLVRSR